MKVMIHMKKRMIIIASIIFIWLCMFVVDNLMVTKYKREPVFCISWNDNGHYTGMGYSFDIYTNPVTEEFEYARSIFGIETGSTFTN